jgi:ADP-ribose pyrophosphatase YjhB (NUDIX family)
LLIRRANTGWRDGEYTLPAGHIDPGESALAAAVHEAREEVCLEIEPENLRLVHVVQSMKSEANDKDFINFYFECDKYSGQAANGEPDKCDDLIWIPPADLDKFPVIDAVRAALSQIARGGIFSFWE